MVILDYIFQFCRERETTINNLGRHRGFYGLSNSFFFSFSCFIFLFVVNLNVHKSVKDWWNGANFYTARWDVATRWRKEISWLKKAFSHFFFSLFFSSSNFFPTPNWRNNVDPMLMLLFISVPFWVNEKMSTMLLPTC